MCIIPMNCDSTLKCKIKYINKIDYYSFFVQMLMISLFFYVVIILALCILLLESSNANFTHEASTASNQFSLDFMKVNKIYSTL